MFYILIFTCIHCILLCTFLTVSMCVCHVEIKRYLLTYLLTYLLMVLTGLPLRSYGPLYTSLVHISVSFSSVCAIFTVVSVRQIDPVYLFLTAIYYVKFPRNRCKNAVKDVKPNPVKRNG